MSERTCEFESRPGHQIKIGSDPFSKAESYEANRSFPDLGTRGGHLVAGCASDDVNYLCSRSVGWRAGNSKQNYGDTRYGYCRLECDDSTIYSGSSIQTAIDARTGPVRQINSAKLQNQRRSYRRSNHVHKYFVLATAANRQQRTWPPHLNRDTRTRRSSGLHLDTRPPIQFDVFSIQDTCILLLPIHPLSNIFRVETTQ